MVQFGRLIGVGRRNGIQVFERFEGSKRIITSLKNSKVFKTIEQTVEKIEDRRKFITSLSEIETHRTLVFDAAGNKIRMVEREVEECKRRGYLLKKYTNGKFSDGNSNNVQAYVSEIETGPDGKEVMQLYRDKINGFSIMGMKESTIQCPIVQMAVETPLESETGVLINRGTYIGGVLDKNGTLVGKTNQTGQQINQDGAQALFDEFKKFFKDLIS